MNHKFFCFFSLVKNTVECITEETNRTEQHNNHVGPHTTRHIPFIMEEFHHHDESKCDTNNVFDEYETSIKVTIKKKKKYTQHH